MPFEQLSNSAVTTLNGAIDNIQTTLVVTSAVGFPTAGNFRIRIDAEILLVTGVSGATFTVTRGQEGTTGAAHSSGARLAHVLTAGAIRALRDEDNVILNNGRLTLTSGVPEGTGTNQSNIYFAPYIGNKISLYDGTRWNPHDFTEISVAVPSTTFRLYDVFIYDNAGTLTLEALDWTTTTGVITGATNASPIVVTSTAHGLSNGDFVGIKNIVGNTAANDLIWQVANVTANTFELLGSTGNGAYVSGGTWHKLNGQTNSGVTTQNGIGVKTGATTKRYLGSGMTGPTSGQSTVDGRQVLLVNVDNRIDHQIARFDATVNTYAASTFRPWNNDGSSHHVYFISPVNKTTAWTGTILPTFRGDGTAVPNIGIGWNSLTGGNVQGPISTSSNTNQRFTGVALNIGAPQGFNLAGMIQARFSTGTGTFDQCLMNIKVPR